MYRPAVIAGGLFAALGLYDVASAVGDWSLSAAQQVVPALSAKAGAVDRSRKGDRLPLVDAVDETNAIATVEIVGLDAAAIVYRDNDGRVLYRTDPAANVTIVSKGVRLPQVTIQERRQEPTRPLPIEVPADGKERPRLVGCDPLASPLAGAAVAGLTGRCMTSLEPIGEGVKLASR
jgi:hypothetical protein